MDIFERYRQDNNKKALLKALKAHFQIKKIHKSIEPYIFGEVPVEGIFQIGTFEGCYQNIFTYDKLFDKLGSGIFPAVLIGGETYGVDFWLVMTNGKVISLHHDASFSEVAYDIETDNADYFVKEFSRQGSIFTIKTLLEFQRLSLTLPDKDAPDYERHLIEITAQSLGRSLAWLSKNIWRLPLEPIFSRARGFLDENGLDDLILAEKKIKKFHKTKATKAKADLSYCFLKSIPELTQNANLLELDLSGNPLQIKDELAQTQLKKLELANCQLSVLPALPATLSHLDIRDNNISDLTPLRHCTQLKYLGLVDNLVPDEQIERFKQYVSNCFIEVENNKFDFESDTLDLSYKNLKKLPKEIAKFKNLRILNLGGNPKLDFARVFSDLAEIAPNLQSLNLQDCKLKELPSEILDLQSLEELTLKIPQYGGYSKWRNELDFDQSFAFLHGLKNLRSLPLTGTGYLREIDVAAYLVYLPHYTNLQIFEFPEIPYGGEDFLRAVMEVVKRLPIHTFIWTKINFQKSIPGVRGFQPYEVDFLGDLTQIKTLIWTSSNYNEHFPAGIFDFPNLETLHVGGGSFDKIPADISRLSQLKKLRFSGGRNFKIPPQISDLKKLEVLEIHADVDEVPAVVGQLSALIELEIRGYVDKIPENIGQLTQLRKMRIYQWNHYWNLKKIPQGITALHNLEELRLITKGCLPDDIDKLQNLRVLDLSRSEHLEALPEGLGRLSNLKKLDLTLLDKLKALPDSFAQLQNLEELSFRGKQLNYPQALKKVAQLTNLKKLEMLELYNEDDFYVPETFAQLNHLRELLLYHSHGMKDLTQTFEVISRLKNLEHLDMTFYSSAFRKKVPRAIGDFKKLQSIKLNLSYRDMPHRLTSQLFDYLSNIPTLRKIEAHQGISYLPPEIGLLKNLEELRLTSTPIKSYPKELLTMTQLKKLDLTSCRLSTTDKQTIKKHLIYTEVVF